MLSNRQLFLSNVAQTSELPLLLEIDRAIGTHIYDRNGKEYLDLNSGISVSSLGHCHPNIVKAIKEQSERHLHTMVYGEHVQIPQVQYSKFLLTQVADKYETLYYLMSGTEAVELALKIAKRSTGRYNVISCRNAYHGSTHGAESLRSDAEYKCAYYPMVPGISHIDFNRFDDLKSIDKKTAAVVIEAVQGEAGVILPQVSFLQSLEERCKEVGAFLILDEIQTGFGRTGHLFAHQKYNLLPDLVLIGKAMGGGMPISGVFGPKDIMNSLIKNPALGHITTFGGHPVSCASALASLKTLLDENIIHDVHWKEALFKEKLDHAIIKEIRSCGLMMAVELTKRKYLKHVVNKAFELGGLVDYFLFNDKSFRLAPPLTISEAEILKGCKILLKAMDFAQDRYTK